MFTGIVTHRGLVKRVVTRRGRTELTIDAPHVARELDAGDSIAVSGVCLTATDAGRRSFTTSAVAETLGRTTLGSVRKGQPVNLELPVRVNDRLGGHLVQGHVDAVARVTRVEDEDGSRRAWFSVPSDELRYVVAKGSVALDGVSLTVTDVGRATFQVVLIPHTLSETTLGDLRVGAEVNLEVDIIGKYVERLMRKG